MNGLRKGKKLNRVQLFTFTQAVHTSSIILFTHVKLNARKNNATVEIVNLRFIYARFTHVNIYARVEIHLHARKKEKMRRRKFTT